MSVHGSTNRIILRGLPLMYRSTILKIEVSLRQFLQIHLAEPMIQMIDAK
jgi:hypothetical protein